MKVLSHLLNILSNSREQISSALNDFPHPPTLKVLTNSQDHWMCEKMYMHISSFSVPVQIQNIFCLWLIVNSLFQSPNKSVLLKDLLNSRRNCGCRIQLINYKSPLGSQIALPPSETPSRNGRGILLAEGVLAQMECFSYLWWESQKCSWNATESFQITWFPSS